MKNSIWLLAFLLLPFLSSAQAWEMKDDAMMKKVKTKVGQMTLREQLAQLMMPALYPKKGESHFSEIDRLVKEEKIGGLIVFQGQSEQVQELLKRYQGDE